MNPIAISRRSSDSLCPCALENEELITILLLDASHPPQDTQNPINTEENETRIQEAITNGNGTIFWVPGILSCTKCDQPAATLPVPQDPEVAMMGTLDEYES